MTDLEKNKKIAEWLGYIVTKYRNEAFIQERYDYYVTYGRDCDGMPLTTEMPDYLNTTAAFDLLDVLVKRGCSWVLDCDGAFSLGKSDIDFYTIKINKSKTRAICEAVLALIEKEKDK